MERDDYGIDNRALELRAHRSKQEEKKTMEKIEKPEIYEYQVGLLVDDLEKQFSDTGECSKEDIALTTLSLLVVCDCSDRTLIEFLNRIKEVYQKAYFL